jgi:hypothetical protein
MKLISYFVSGLLFSRKAALTCSRASSFVLFTAVLEATLGMALATAVLMGG